MKAEIDAKLVSNFRRRPFAATASLGSAGCWQPLHDLPSTTAALVAGGLLRFAPPRLLGLAGWSTL
eukprot:11720471-Prorocentrum_lima.AAC.1